MALLGIRGLSVVFDTEAGPIRACDRVDLDIPAERTVGLIGESGCGKSVLGRAVLRLLPSYAAVSGEVWYRDKDIRALDAARLRSVRGKEIALLPQSPARSLNPVLTIGSQIAEGLALHRGLGARRAWRKAVELLERLKSAEPDKLARAYPHQLSGGMQQRALAAASITGRPALLIVDEPTKGLDAVLRMQVAEVLRRLVRKLGAAMLLITHDLKVAAALCDDIAVMYAGGIVERGPTAQLLAAPVHPYTQGLLAALPEHGLHCIPGESPGLSDLPAGCKFYGRCTRARKRCADQCPPWRKVNGTYVRCFAV